MINRPIILPLTKNKPSYLGCLPLNANSSIQLIVSPKNPTIVFGALPSPVCNKWKFRLLKRDGI